jgi:ankyrin repeat protein
MLASKRGWEQIVMRLIKQSPRPDANLQSDRGKTALWWAARNEYDSIIGLLITIRADVDIPDKNNHTAILTAVKRGN